MDIIRDPPAHTMQRTWCARASRWQEGRTRHGAEEDAQSGRRSRRKSRPHASDDDVDEPGAPGGAPGQPGFAESQSSSYVTDFLTSSEGVALNRAFARIADAKVRRRVIDLVEALADKPSE